MGVWGYHNFDADDALNELSGWINQIIAVIRQAYNYDSTDSIYDDRGDAGSVSISVEIEKDE